MEPDRRIHRFIAIAFVMMFMALSSLVFARQILVRQAQDHASMQSAASRGAA